MFEIHYDSPPLQRLPGLYRRWEIAELLKTGEDFRIEDAGTTLDGTQLLAVYRLEAGEAFGTAEVADARG